jgi:hypothetical protein
MKRLVIAVLLFLVCQLLLAPVHTSASDVGWNPGYYTGLVEFQEEIVYQENRTVGGVTYKQETNLIYDMSGQILCIVSDFDGNGTCTGRFPTQKHEKTLITLISPDCTATREEHINAPAVIGLVGIPPAVSKTLSIGFSIPFTPQTGLEEGSTKTWFSGTPACNSLSKVTTKTDISIPEWPNLDFKITNRSPQIVHGYCTIQSFLHKELPYGIFFSKISKCKWSMSWADITAKLP